MSLAVKRAYEDASPDDGARVLVDGLWPRGLSKEKLKLAEWMKAIAPSAALRKWYGHKPEKWEEFRRRYREELSKPPRRELLGALARRARREKVTLVIGARDAERANGAVLAELIREKGKRG